MLRISFEAEAPSNIALIKYMGKSNAEMNAATNSSLSYSLPSLRTRVCVESSVEPTTTWEPMESNFRLSDLGKKKFLTHWERCRVALAPDFKESVIIRSGNNFPSDCGMASSASSFAALTLAVYGYFNERKVLNRSWSTLELAQLSRQGSGSSCRSFFEPWTLWKNNHVERLTTYDQNWSHLLHSVVVSDETPKKISSSEAHLRVQSSDLFTNRIDRAERRCQRLIELLKGSNTWKDLFELVWVEFWDMHALFETSLPPFYYMNSQSLLALRCLQEEWEGLSDGPLITMDAGPNVHLLYRNDQKELRDRQHQFLRDKKLRVIDSEEVMARG